MKKIDKISPIQFNNQPTNQSNHTQKPMNTETINQIALYAIKTNSVSLLQSVAAKGKPTNSKECFDKMIEKNWSDSFIEDAIPFFADPFEQETINKIARYTIVDCSVKLLQSIAKKGNPTNSKECFDWAIESHATDGMFKEMITLFSDPFAQETIDWIAMYAVSNENKSILDSILKKGKPTNLKECLNAAMEKNDPTIVEILVKLFEEQKAAVPPTPTPTKPRDLVDNIELSINDRVTAKNTPLMYAIYHLKPDILLNSLNNCLISKAEINHRNSDGWSVLMLVCKYANWFKPSDELVQKLLEFGANPSYANYEGDTAFSLIYKNMTKQSVVKENIMKLLLKHPDTYVPSYVDHIIEKIKPHMKKEVVCEIADLISSRPNIHFFASFQKLPKGRRDVIYSAMFDLN